MKCKHCSLVKPDVRMRPDPYQADLFDDWTLHPLCEDCYYAIGEDI